MELIDNVQKKLADDLRQTLTRGSKVRIAAGAFSIYAYEALRKELDRVDELRFIFSSPTFIEESLKRRTRQFYIPHIYHEADLCGGEFEIRLKNELQQRAIARECSDWVRQKVTFKTNRHSTMPLNGLIHIQEDNEGEGYAYSNINGFTTSDLGLTHKKGFPALIQKAAFPHSQAFLDWFDQIWENEENLEDVTQQVQEYFENAFKENSPEFIYFLTLYHIFNEFLDDLSQDNLPNDQIGFKETQVWQKLYDFQKDAVIGAINKLEKYNGCVLADSVGLGKTFSALGVIKYYELRNKDVLVLCPKKLEANWNTFRYNDKNNMLAQDRFRYDVLFHTDLSRDRGLSNGRNLENVNWGNYGLVVIDESHNFRNNNAVADRETRYQRLLNRIIRDGIETKVLMLSATPVNNRFNDLKNQLALAYEGHTEDIDEKLDTENSIEIVFRRAQQAFNTWSKLDTHQRSSERLLDMLDFDFFKVLDSLTIARSRKHITAYYDTTAIGKFPERNKPVSIRTPLTKDGTLSYTYIAERLGILNLSVYTPLSYLLPSKVRMYADLYDKEVRSGKLSQVDRERSLRVLMRINLLKRLESSVDSFRLTLEGIISQIENSLMLIEKHQERDVSSGIATVWDDENFDWEADWGDEEQVIGKKIKVHIADMDTRKWAEDLKEDLYLLQQLHENILPLIGPGDTKLELLKEELARKVTQPINSNNKKILIFTAFADTANYLYHHLADFAWQEFGLHTAIITGSTRRCTSKNIPFDFNTLLTCFSPRSKEKDLLYPQIAEEIDIMIATDCISEGQNLQDCDYLINYDIHWNPVRITQRFGRIDRIGSINDTITMVNFWPDMELDDYINLKERVEDRMLIGNMASTGDDNLLKVEEAELEYRKVQLRKLQEEVMDLEDFKEGITITDLGLSDFRVDLSNLIKTYGEPKHIPEGVHAVVPGNERFDPGVLFVLKNINEGVNIDKLNRLHPYYLVYLSETGECLINHVDAKKSLDAFRNLSKGLTEPDLATCRLVDQETADYTKMEHYSGLLQQAIKSILRTEEEKEIKSLFRPGGTAALQTGIKGMEDFELIAFLIIK